jgi:transketolase
MEYARNAVRLAALMKAPNIFVYTHDSVAVGEDGPTHQPVEQITNLRTTPNLNTWRPCDTVESAIAWQSAIASRETPSALIFTRQKTVAQARDKDTFNNVKRGGYILRDTDGQPDAIVIATGSEVELAVAAAESLASANVQVRVVSMPCVEVFSEQSAQYKESVLPNNVRARVAVEAGHPDIWHRFVGLDGVVVGISSFGMSAPGAQALAELGITTENVVQQVQSVIAAAS